MRLCLLLILFCIYVGELQAKVRILTFHYNKADFIEMQDLTLKRFMKQDYELIVFNDARTSEHENEIRTTCQRLGVTCIRFDQSWHYHDPLNEYLLQHLINPEVHSHIGFHEDTIQGIGNQPSVRHCHVIQFALDHFGYDHNDLVVIMDGDIFPIRPIDLRSLMKKSQMMGIYKYIAEQNVGYFWVPFISIDMPRMPKKNDLKFHVDLIKDYIFDTGAHSYHYLRNNPEVVTRKFDWISSSSHHYETSDELESFGFTKEESQFIQELPWPSSVEFHIDKHFLHFAGSSFCLQGHDIKSEHVIAFLKKITE